MTDRPKVYEHKFFLTAGECNACGELPVALAVERMIEVATFHANILGIGYAHLHPLGVGWVLSRIGFELQKTPVINDHFIIATWIESWNRLYSERCYRFSDAQGNVFGWGRSIWAIIDINTRQVAEMSRMEDCRIDECIAGPLENPMARMRNHRPVPEVTEQKSFEVCFSDLDFNRHVNSARYIEHILNMWKLSHFDKYRIDRFEISYRHECLEGQIIDIKTHQPAPELAAVQLERDGDIVVTSSISFEERKKND